MNYIRENLSRRMKEYRRKNHLTQEEAAEKFGISTIYYGEIERGNRIPSGGVLMHLCDGIGCSFEDITYSAATKELIQNSDEYRTDITEIIRMLHETPEITECVLSITQALHKEYSKKKK